MWWLTVGWDLPSGSCSSQEQTSSWEATMLSRRSRTGSARAANTLARSVAWASLSDEVSGAAVGAEQLDRGALPGRRHHEPSPSH